jgi:signal transduction histidine kinase
MRPPSRLLAPRSWLRPPARTARLRLTLLYGGLFLACGAVLLAINYLLSAHAIDNGHGVRLPTSRAAPALPSAAAQPPAGSQAAAYLAGQVAAQRASDLHGLLINSGIALAIVATLALLLGWYVAGRVLRPVRTITATARRISASNLHERLALDDSDEEFRQLGDTLDDLFARLEIAFEAQRHFVANASHELRTPLAWEQTLLQFALANPDATNAALRETCEKALAASKQQQGLIEALLTLATSERELDHHEPIDLSVLTDAALLAARPQAEQCEIQITVATEPAPTSGHPALVERLITNLIDNAVLHNNPGGHLHVQTTTTPDGYAQLVASNSGPEIPPTEIQRLFEPFQRLKNARNNGQGGYGLGLSIVDAIATTHHAQLTARPRNGGGLEVQVSFPATTATLHEQPTSRTRRHHGRDQLLTAQEQPHL